MFPWGKTKAPLAETLGLYTLKYRESRDKYVAEASNQLLSKIHFDLEAHSRSSIIPQVSFDFSNVETLKTKMGRFDAAPSEVERDRILANVVAKLKEEKLDASVERATIEVKWTVPVVVPPTVAPATTVVDATKTEVAVAPAEQDK